MLAVPDSPPEPMPMVPDNPPVEKDGRIYGITKGSFRSRWWNYYERGLSFMQGSLWEHAEKDFRAALAQSDRDERRVRTYGRHLTEYFPHRELGICLFQQNRIAEAAAELERSLSFEKTAKAEFYLDKARKTRMEQENLDHSPPQVQMESPKDGILTNALSCKVQGLARDDSFVSRIRINGKSVRIDLSAPEIRFQKEIPLKIGENRILVQTEDLSGKKTEMQRRIFCDRSGPVVSIENAEHDRLHRGKYRVLGYAHDISGIQSVRINGQFLPDSSGREIRIDHVIAVSPSEKSITVTAEDRAGNQTHAHIRISETAAGSDLKSPVLLASGEDFFLSSPRGIRTSEKQMEQYQAQRGACHALLIGIDAYEHWTKLKNAVRDAAEIRKILVSRYGFDPENTVLITDREAGWKNLMQKMKDMAAQLGRNDSFLLYFAGHGQLDRLTGDGYWIPADGGKDDPASWITNSAIRNLFASPAVKARHVLIVADSCYSGSLLRRISSAEEWETQEISGQTRGSRDSGSSAYDAADLLPFQKRVMELDRRRSRQVIASGGMERVSDISGRGKGEHSLFAHYLLKALEENRHPVTDIEYLFHTNVWKHVVDRGGQRPVMGRLYSDSDEDGQFVLMQKNLPMQNFPVDREVLTAERTGMESGEPGKADNQAPEIVVKGWDAEGTVYLDQVFLEMQVRDASGIQRVSINGFPLVSRPGKNLHCNYLAQLKEGENAMVLECSDQLGNTAVRHIRIHRQIPKVYDSGSRMSVALSRFDLKGQTDYGIEELFRTRLCQSGRFDIRITEERENPLQSAKKMGAEYLLRGEIVSTPNSLQMAAQIIGTSDADMLICQDVYGENTAPEGIRDLSQGLVLKLCEELPLIDGEIADIRGEKIFINRGTEHRLKKGMPLIFFETGDPIRNPVTGEELGADTMEQGMGRIWQLNPGISVARREDREKNDDLKKGGRFVTK
ncbi:MAG: caspase family protein [Desulfobacterales bacterium]